METWLKRVVEEQQALDEKIEKLIGFMQSEGYAKLKIEQRLLLGFQLDVMKEYTKLLSIRIAYQ